jgi:uncharacterized protein YceH (UPF0502 family)
MTSAEVRVLGCLLEKQRTTPDAYPLSLNALRLACNQSTNRDPVVDYDEAVLRDALHRLERRGLTRLASGAGSRAAKHRHLLAEALPMDAGEQAVMCVLMLRGAQTPGELKQRSERMHAFPELDGVQETLRSLIERGLVQRLERRPGQKEERYQQLLQVEAGEEMGERYQQLLQVEAGEEMGEREREARPVTPAAPAAQGVRPALGTQSAPSAPSTQSQPDADLRELLERVARLEREVAELRRARQEPVGVPRA